MRECQRLVRRSRRAARPVCSCARPIQVEDRESRRSSREGLGAGSRVGARTPSSGEWSGTCAGEGSLTRSLGRTDEDKGLAGLGLAERRIWRRCCRACGVNGRWARGQTGVRKQAVLECRARSRSSCECVVGSGASGRVSAGRTTCTVSWFAGGSRSWRGDRWRPLKCSKGAGPGFCSASPTGRGSTWSPVEVSMRESKRDAQKCARTEDREGHAPAAQRQTLPSRHPCPWHASKLRSTASGCLLCCAEHPNVIRPAFERNERTVRSLAGRSNIQSTKPHSLTLTPSLASRRCMHPPGHPHRQQHTPHTNTLGHPPRPSLDGINDRKRTSTPDERQAGSRSFDERKLLGREQRARGRRVDPRLGLRLDEMWRGPCGTVL